LRDGVATGELVAEADVEAMAWHYLDVLQSLLNLPQTGADPAMLDRMVAVAMSAWPKRTAT
jgi:TetR/AcrR family transcriptional regulator, copper-responsive repressor